MHFRENLLHIGEVPVTELVRRFGSPLYVYDQAILERQVTNTVEAFSSVPFQPFYAAKANSNLALLRTIKLHGFGCDAVSPGEVFLARRADFPPDRIWFTCSNVSDDDLKAIQDQSIVINVNSMSEIDRIIRLEIKNSIALRVNPEVGAGHHRDVVTGGFGVKFGIDLAELDEARTIAEDNDLEVVGLHAHIGSGIDQLEPLLESARKILSVTDRFPRLQWLNFGGGISVPYKPGEVDFPIREYGKRLSELVGKTL